MNDFRGATVNISLEEFDRMRKREEKSQKELSDLRKKLRACVKLDTAEYLLELDRIDSDMPDATDEELDEAERKAQSKIAVTIKVEELKKVIAEHCCNVRENANFSVAFEMSEEQQEETC